jgi:hypothetical protein
MLGLWQTQYTVLRGYADENSTSGLPSTVTDSRLHDFFQNYGQVADAVNKSTPSSGILSKI